MWVLDISTSQTQAQQWLFLYIVNWTFRFIWPSPVWLTPFWKISNRNHVALCFMCRSNWQTIRSKCCEQPNICLLVNITPKVTPTPKTDFGCPCNTPFELQSKNKTGKSTKTSDRITTLLGLGQNIYFKRKCVVQEVVKKYPKWTKGNRAWQSAFFEQIFAFRKL